MPSKDSGGSKQVVTLPSTRLTFLAFLGLLIASVVTVAVGATQYSLGLSAVCVTPWLIGFLVTFLRLVKFERISGRILRLVLYSESVHGGDILSGRVEIYLSRPRHVKSLSIRIWGGECTEILESTGKYTIEHKDEKSWADQELELVPEGLTSSAAIHRPKSEPMPAGRFFYRFTHVIPLRAVPTWSGDSAKAFAFVKVQIDMGGMATVASVREFSVLPPAISGNPGGGTFESQDRLLQAGTTRLILTLDSLLTSQEGKITGKVSITDMKADRLRGYRIRLVEVESAIAKGIKSVHRKILAETNIPAADFPVGSAPFGLTVPNDSRPSISGRISRLHHMVEAKANIKLGRDLVAQGGITVLPNDGWHPYVLHRGTRR